MAPENRQIPAESSFELLQRARGGDHTALDRLVALYLPRLRRWATGRLPAWARDMADTQDLVQEALIQTFRKIESFEWRGDGALQAYLRQVVLNRIRDELRRAGRRPPREALDTQAPDSSPSPLEEAVGSEALDRYEQALQRLRPQEREAIVMRIELGFTHEQLATALNKPSANAARMAVERALLRLAAEMRAIATGHSAPKSQ